MSWKDVLAGDMPADWAREIDVFETQIELKKQGKLTDQLFAETRLRRGAYGQRYDNGQRNDGTGTKTLAFPSPLTKGPETLWDAPGMLRIKIPFGGMTPRQMEVLADLCEEYSDNICHVTTRQDFQLHYVHIDDTPDIMRRLAAVGITTREACGNSVRNVTGCPLAGVCRDEQFDISPYAQAMMRFMLGHPDTMDFGRKFKIAFSGCGQHACGLVNMHDLGLLAVTRVENGVARRGFTMYVGGGLGAVPHQAKILEEFVSEEELLPISQAIARVFARLGEKRNRARARIKFVVKHLGIDEFRRLVGEERAKLPHDPRWTSYLPSVATWSETPLKPGAPLTGAGQPQGIAAAWQQYNVYRQRQAGYCVVTVALPLGDITADQMRALADIARRYVGESVRTTVDQNIVLRWVREADLPDIYRDLTAAQLGAPGAQTIVDVTSCPGTDTCKLGIASSRGLAGELRERLTEKAFELDAAVRGLHIKISGCFNSCGQHHVADLGFYGVSRQVGGYQVPHFQVVLGGQWEHNGGSYGLPIGAVPSKNIPAVVDRLTERYVRDRQGAESFQQFCQRIGKKALKAMLDEFSKVPAHDEHPEFYADWGDPREFTTGDMGTGECAGEVVSLVEFDLADAEREVFEAQLALEAGDAARADVLAYRAMLQAAKALVKTQFLDVGDEPARIVAEFKTRFCDTELFYDRFAKGMVAGYLFRRHEEGPGTVTAESAHQLVEEASLFVEAGHACQLRMAQQKAGPAAAAAAQVVSLDGLN